MKDEQPHILLIDDNPNNLQILINYLRHQKYAISVAVSAQEAYSMIEEEFPDLILLDIMMPDIDGFEVCKALKQNERTKDIPVIFITALTDYEHRVRGFDVGGVDYITKPFSKEEVLARISTHITMQRQSAALKALNVDMHATNLALHNAVSSKDKMLAVISHDLRGPMGNIFNLLQMIVEDDLSEKEKKDLLNDTIKAVRSTYDMLENLLFWAKSQRKEIEPSPVTFDLCEILEDNVRLLSSMAADKQIEIRAPQNLSVELTADANMVNVIVRNLISNAIKFTPNGGTVILNCSELKEQVILTVTDTGIGIEPEVLQHLFDADFHYSTRGTNYEKGTGIGLSLSYDFAKRIGGDLTAESVLGKGSTFSVRFPRH